MTISLIENTNRKNTRNKVIYPEFYRFVNLVLETILTFEPIHINREVKYEYEQSLNETEEEVQEKIPTIKTTSILKMMCQNNLKKNKKTKATLTIDFDEVIILLIAKSVSLLIRSL